MQELKYLFECHFVDGTVYQQNPEDTSTSIPGKSAFTDVLQRIDDVVVFGIFNNETTYAVDLRDGHFEINQVPFEIALPDDLVLSEDVKFDLVYFRRVKHNQVLGQLMTEESTTIDYHFGWKTTVNDKEYQQVLIVKG